MKVSVGAFFYPVTLGTPQSQSQNLIKVILIWQLNLDVEWTRCNLTDELKFSPELKARLSELRRYIFDQMQISFEIKMQGDLGIVHINPFVMIKVE